MKMSILLSAIVLGSVSLGFSTASLADTNNPVGAVVHGTGQVVGGVVRGTGEVVGGVVRGTGDVLVGTGHALTGNSYHHYHHHYHHHYYYNYRYN